MFVAKRLIPIVVLLGASLFALILLTLVQARSGLGQEGTSQSRDDEAERHCVATVDTSEVECFAAFDEAVDFATGGRITDAPNDASAAAQNQEFRESLFASEETDSRAETNTSEAGETTSQVEDVVSEEPPPAPEAPGLGTPSASSDGAIPTPSETTSQVRETTSSESGDFSTQNHNNDVVGCCAILSVEYENDRYRGNSLTYRASSGCDRNRDVDWQVPNVGSDWNDTITSFIAAGRCTEAHFENDFYGGRATARQVQDPNMGGFNDLTTSIRWY